ncbi:hypothetical protein AQPE_0352 [Aquipluma nitroreducens]|uniref:Uncharacterized protein n=1 Tax=Aquipluma nitroreducens TaxID=2010828 RepID=A0A5K7S416_9BACT|nr:hypothetical protein [Aquipluma nitroreducens]BBE16215.1 hypothetical protein AQPE_0352 [Aquipluma nitroreducens]
MPFSLRFIIPSFSASFNLRYTAPAKSRFYFFLKLETLFSGATRNFNGVTQAFSGTDQAFNGTTQVFSGTGQTFSGITQEFSGTNLAFSRATLAFSGKIPENRCACLFGRQANTSFSRLAVLFSYPY